MSEEKPDKVEIPIGDPYLEELDPELHSANSLAHRVAKAVGELQIRLQDEGRWPRPTVGYSSALNRRHEAERALWRTYSEYKKLVSRTTEEEAD